MDNIYNFSHLNAGGIPVLRETFLAAFADYFLPLQLSEEQFKNKLAKEGVELGFCGGAYQNSELAGFILTGLGEWHEIPTAYNAGTGVLPAHRGKGLTEQLYSFMLKKFRESGIEQCLLEVIQENQAALKVYEKLGFKIVRSLDCFRALKKDIDLSSELIEPVTVQTALKPDWNAYAEFHAIAPSWQNKKEAFKRSLEKKIILEARIEGGSLAGYAAFYPATGSVAQIAVHSSYCGRGIGTALLKEAVRHIEAPAIMINNVDASSKDFQAFMECRKINRFLGQHEMILKLND